METVAIIAASAQLLQIAFNLWSTANQAKGTEEIPSWEEMLEKNAVFQGKIDAEK